jgi:hypothetical protein
VKETEELVLEDSMTEVFTRILEYNDSKQINLNHLSIEHLVVASWLQLRNVLCLILAKEQEQNT